jgi:uncharacterized Zn finger protein (UPF0148 family)
MYPEKIDRTKLNNEEVALLTEFSVRRKLFDEYITNNNLNLFTCPGCGFPTLDQRGGFLICPICDWEDDYQDDKNADEIWGGPNSLLSLTENRINIGKTLTLIAKEMNGQINLNPSQVLKILATHNRRIEKMRVRTRKVSDISDPIWIEYSLVKNKVLNDLIKSLN